MRNLKADDLWLSCRGRGVGSGGWAWGGRGVPVHTACLTLHSQAPDSRPRLCHPMPRVPPAAVGPRRLGQPWSGDRLR